MSELYLPVDISFDGFPEPILLLQGGVVCYRTRRPRLSCRGWFAAGRRRSL